eukprot:Rhum_TRINITY_DN14979_c2_g1::Rhum_TRINITY_DN14979_c2_g1_i1::g.131828::m.131828/K14618/MMACHC; methylmalonic aciduria homocystinuria type C protein
MPDIDTSTAASACDSPAAAAFDAHAADFAAALCEKGFDVCAPFHAEWYNEHIRAEGLCPDRLQALPHARRCFIIGNSKAMWPKFMRWLSLRVAKLADGDEEVDASMIPPDPLNRFAEEAIGSVVADFSARFGSPDASTREVFWAGNVCDSRFLVSMQRVAVLAGIVHHDANTMLTIHPVFGAWKAYRAVVAFDIAEAPHGPVPPLPPAVPCLMSAAEQEAAGAAREAALAASNTKDLCKQLHGGVGVRVNDAYKYWIKARDCVELGRAEHRYSPAQVEYHYTKDVEVLVVELNKMRAAA